MRNSARLVAGFVSALTLVALPVASADAAHAQLKPMPVHCCR